MKAEKIIEKLFSLAEERDYSQSCDKCIMGNPEKEVSKVAVCMFLTPEIIKDAAEWGAEMVITHEPVFHSPAEENDALDIKKRELMESSGMTFYRYHDHTHYTRPDIIAAGEFKALGLEGEMELTDIFDLLRLNLKNPVSAVELAKLIEDKLGIKHVRICGNRDFKATKLSGVFGAASNCAFNELRNPESQIVIVGETCEWRNCEYVRDAAQLGIEKAMLILGHAGSERDGMIYTAEILSDMFPETEVKYFEGGETYTYTD